MKEKARSATQEALTLIWDMDIVGNDIGQILESTIQGHGDMLMCVPISICVCLHVFLHIKVITNLILND